MVGGEQLKHVGRPPRDDDAAGGEGEMWSFPPVEGHLRHASGGAGNDGDVQEDGVGNNGVGLDNGVGNDGDR